MADSEATLDRLARQIRRCTKCPLHTSRTHAVPGEGPANARAMIIGEAPGEEEDATGRPFVGPAGSYLSKVLDEAGLERGDFFITNVVKCRPPENRKPRASEKDTCTSTYLFEQIEQVRPRVIVLLGGTAAQFMLADVSSIEAARGTTIKQDGQRYVVTYHPASRFYRGDLGEKIKEDFVRLKRVLAQV